MCSTHSSPLIHYWAGRYPGKIGWLFGPAGEKKKKKKLRPWLPYALDNDAFIAWTQKTPWDEKAYFAMLDTVARNPLKPLWALVPDVVADPKATIENWARYRDRVAAYGFPLAFAMQDGMEPADVPQEASMVFIGGSTEWKWRNVARMTKALPAVHVGRVNTLDRLWLCHDLGCRSVDGTGWFREGESSFKLQRLESYFEGRREQELGL